MLVVDTGPLFGSLDADDPDHARCVALLSDPRADLVVPAPVLVELDYFVRKLLGVDVWHTFAADVAEGVYRLEHLDERNVAAALELRDLGLGRAEPVHVPSRS